MKSHSEQLDEIQQAKQQLSKERKLLEAQQAYNEKAPLELKVALAHLEQAKREKLSLEQELTSLKDEIKSKESELLGIKQNIDKFKNDSNIQKKNEQSKINSIESSKTKAQVVLLDINDQIKERKQYLKDQEELIIETSLKGNESFEELQLNYSQLERIIKGKELEKIRLGDEIASLIIDSEKIDREFSDKIIYNETEIEKATKELHQIQTKAQETEAQCKIMIKTVEDRKNELRAEAESIDAKLAALHKETRDFSQVKRRYSSSNEGFDL